MKQEFKTKLLTALTDGSYKRVINYLVTSDDNTMRCCLGVARAVATEMGLLPPIDQQELWARGGQFLTPVELEVIGLDDATQKRLSKYNDYSEVPDGQYYPQEVIDAITALPTENCLKFLINKL